MKMYLIATCLGPCRASFRSWQYNKSYSANINDLIAVTFGYNVYPHSHAGLSRYPTAQMAQLLDMGP